MRFLGHATAVALLLACSDQSGTPTQPTAASGAAPAAAAVVETDHVATATRGFYVGRGPTGAAISLGTGFSVIQKVSLPAGSYVVTASAVLASSDPEPRLVDCIFSVGGLTTGQLSRGVVGGLPNAFLTLPNTIVFSISVRTNLSMACRADVGNRVFSQPSPLTAIQVGSVTVVRP